ncbi:unnamed protein product [Euphydryas editha]|nr:unnamed protein product [Euphydryas editha]
MSNIIYVLVLASLLCCVQCLPLETESKTTSEDALHLFVHNSTKNLNYHISSIATELEDIDEEIAKELDTILPYINFLFNALWGQSGDSSSNGDECLNDMIIQLVPDNNDVQNVATGLPAAA